MTYPNSIYESAEREQQLKKIALANRPVPQMIYTDEYHYQKQQIDKGRFSDECCTVHERIQPLPEFKSGMTPHIANALWAIARKCRNRIFKPLMKGANPNYVAAQMGHSDAQMVYRVYGAWMSENNTDQLSLINTKMNDLVLHTCFAKVAVQLFVLLSVIYPIKPAYS